MKIIHYGSLVLETGGPAYSTYLSMKGVQCYGRACGMQCEIIMHPPAPQQHLIATDIPMSFTSDFDSLSAFLRTKEPDLLHIQGIWSPMGHQMVKYARKNNIPYIIALRGMLYPQALAKKSLKKKLAMWLYQANDLRHASCIQATCEEEKEFYRKLGFRNPVAIIPNAVELSAQREPTVSTDPTLCIGYLGRVHPRKRIERIFYALAAPEMQGVPTRTLIIGRDNLEYEQFLKKEVQRLGLKNVEFSGFLKGQEKLDAIRSLSLLVVPSDFENFGNIVVEALKEGIPVAASQGTPWRDLELYHCGWWIPNDVPSLAKMLKEAASLTPEQWVEMGKSGRKLLQEKYAFEVVSQKMVALYQWLLQRGKQPDFVETLE